MQRVRAQGTAQVEDQEIFRELSLLPAADGYLPRALAASQLVQLAGEIPAQRPNQTLNAASGMATGYVNSNSDGDDGAPLTDYDLIGRDSDRTGLFALNEADYFNFLCIPPLARDQDVGPMTLLVGARYCKERRALLILDPPSHWHTADDALRGMRNWNFFNENALMYFPRVLAHDKLRGHFESFAPCGAVAGMLARCDQASPVWAPAKSDEAILRPGYRPACLVTEDRRMRLATLGVNTLLTVRSAVRIGVAARTLAAGTAGSADWQYLGGAAPGIVHRQQHRAGHPLGGYGAAARGGRGVGCVPGPCILRVVVRCPGLRLAAIAGRFFRRLRPAQRFSIGDRFRRQSRAGLPQLSHRAFGVRKQGVSRQPEPIERCELQSRGTRLGR